MERGHPGRTKKSQTKPKGHKLIVQPPAQRPPDGQNRGVKTDQRGLKQTKMDRTVDKPPSCLRGLGSRWCEGLAHNLGKRPKRTSAWQL